MGVATTKPASRPGRGALRDACTESGLTPRGRDAAASFSKSSSWFRPSSTSTADWLKGVHSRPRAHILMRSRGGHTRDTATSLATHNSSRTINLCPLSQADRKSSNAVCFITAANAKQGILGFVARGKVRFLQHLREHSIQRFIFSFSFIWR